MVSNSGRAVVGGVRRGRPVGSKSDYTVSEDALSQRRMAALKHGNNSLILSKYLSSKSPVPGIADGDIVALRKELYLNNLVRMIDEPTIVTMDVLSWLLTDLELAKLEADRSGEILSDKLLKAAKLATDLSTSLAKLQHGSKQTIEVKHLRDVFSDGEMVIPVKVTRGGVGEDV